MSSFYGNHGIGGGGGSSSYDQLTNVPIKNIGGETGVTNLALLETGHYSLRGTYKISSESSEEITNYSNLDVIVLTDKITNTRTVEFLTVENQEVYFNIFTYDSDNKLLKQEKKSILSSASPTWGEL